MGDKRWIVEVTVAEYGDRTRAKARMTFGNRNLTGVGFARLNPADTYVVQIGDELAVARALADLTHQLLVATDADIETSTHESVKLVH